MTIPNLGAWGHVLFPLSFCRGGSQPRMLTGIIEKAWERYWCPRPKPDQLNEHVEVQEQAVHRTVMHCEGCTQESLNDKLSSSGFSFLCPARLTGWLWWAAFWKAMPCTHALSQRCVFSKGGLALKLLPARLLTPPTWCQHTFSTGALWRRVWGSQRDGAVGYHGTVQ